MKIGLTISQDLDLSGSTYFILEGLLKCEVVSEIYIIKIIAQETNKKKRKNFTGIQFSWINKVIIYMEKFMNFTGAYFSVRLPKEQKNSILNKCDDIIEISQTREGYFSYTSTEKILKYNLDFIIHGNGLLIEHGDLLDSGHKFGLISLHHGDNDFYRGGPPGFWEVFNKEKESGIVLQKLNKQSYGGEILKKVFLETKATFQDNYNNLISYSGYVVIAFLREFYQKRGNPLPLSYQPDFFNIYSNIIYKKPNVIYQYAYLLKILGIFFRLSVERLKSIIFRILINNSNGWMILVGEKKNRLEKWNNSAFVGPEFWLADPFFLQIKKNNFLVFEKFLNKKKYGNISYCKLSSKGIPDFSNIYELVDDGNHKSYPFTFDRNGKYYCMPESQEHGIEIYQIDLYNGQLSSKKIKNLLKGNYTEPTLIRKDSVDFLFVNPKGPSSPRSILEIYFCKNILLDDLQPHPLNPVIISSRFARSAGRIIKKEDKFYRPSQNCLGNYGQSIDFCEIDFSKNYFKYKYLNSVIPKSKFKLLHHFDKTKIDDVYFYCTDTNSTKK